MKKYTLILIGLIIVFFLGVDVGIKYSMSSNILPPLSGKQVYEISTPNRQYTSIGPIHHKNNTYQFKDGALQDQIISDNMVQITKIFIQ